MTSVYPNDICQWFNQNLHLKDKKFKMKLVQQLLCVKMLCRKSFILFCVMLALAGLLLLVKLSAPPPETNIQKPESPIFTRSFRSCGVDEDKISVLREFILNHTPKLRNARDMPPLEPNHFIIIVLIRHTLADLHRLINNLRNVPDIDKSLLIFSFMYEDQARMLAIEGIKFARVIPIYFPFSDQVCPDFFPGPSEYHCPVHTWCRDVKPGRNFSLVQEKHFWWWTVNYVFDIVNLFREYNSEAIVIEDDDVVTADLLHVAELLDRSVVKVCPNCTFLSVGNKAKDNSGAARAAAMPFQSSAVRTGLIINPVAYDYIKKSALMFCSYDDFDWSSSLRGFLTDANIPLVYAVEKPRVLKMDDFKRLWGNEAGLFPIDLEPRYLQARPAAPARAGGWTDARDTALCLLTTKLLTVYGNFYNFERNVPLPVMK